MAKLQSSYDGAEWQNLQLVPSEVDLEGAVTHSELMFVTNVLYQNLRYLRGALQEAYTVLGAMQNRALEIDPDLAYWLDGEVRGDAEEDGEAVPLIRPSTT